MLTYEMKKATRSWSVLFVSDVDVSELKCLKYGHVVPEGTYCRLII